MAMLFLSSPPRMVPTTVERLREGQGVRERLLRGIKVERSYKRADGSTEMESGEKNHHTLETNVNVEGEQLAFDSDAMAHFTLVYP